MPARSTDDRRDMPPIGRLIEDARERAGMSQRTAAAVIGISGRGWGYLVNGFKIEGGEQVRTGGRPETLARMAQVVGLTPKQVEPVRADVAEYMRRRPSIDQPVGYDLPTVLNLLETIRANCDPAILQEALQQLGLAPRGGPNASRSRARP